jgi:GH24 family phage-related lysozyme (muramidase)
MELIKRFEGCAERLPDGRLKAYKKPGDPWTIGWGITGAMPDGRPVTDGLVITQQEADTALEWFVKNVSDPLTRKHFNAQSQAEFDALSSWVFNINQGKLERGEYTLPALVNLRARDLDAVIAKWIQYKNPGTIFEQGLYRRRLAELCMFFGWPWHFALSAVLKRENGNIVDMTPPDYILELAEQAKPIASLPDPPKPAKPVVPVKVEPLPEVKPEPQVGTKPISPKTVKPEEVPYKIDPNAGLKPLEESERAIGYFWQNLARLFLRLTGLGTFGTAAAGVANVVQSDAVLGTALLDLTIPLLVFLTGIVIAFVMRSYGDWRRKRGQESAVQAMY